MQRMLWMRRLALIACLALFAAACNGDNGEATDEETPAEQPADEETPADDEETPAADDEDDETAGEDVERGDGTLRIGYILPETGPLAFLGPPQIEAVNLAIEDINAAGGVLDTDVELLTGDEAGDAGVASQTAERLLGDGVDAIVGAAASGMSLAFIDQVVGAEVVQCSASNTSPTFTNYEDNGFYFRTAPTDALQGPVLAETIVADGNTNVAVLARADDYGQGLADATIEALGEQGADVAAEIIYDPEAATFDAEVQQVADSGADAVALISFDEGAQILQGMIEAGFGPEEVAVYGADGLAGGELPEQVDPGNPNILDGMRGTRPSPQADPEFLQRFQDETGLDDTTFSPQAYDCTIIIALAAASAGSDDPRDFQAEMLNVTQDGTECSSYEECLGLIDEGEDIMYAGPTATEFTEEGEPSVGQYEVWEFVDGALEGQETVESTLEG